MEDFDLADQNKDQRAGSVPMKVKMNSRRVAFSQERV